MSWLRIAFGTLLLATNTVLHVPPLLLAAVVKAVLPLRPIRRACDWLLMAIAARPLANPPVPMEYLP